MRAVSASASGVINGNAQGKEGMSNTFGFGRSADNLNYGVGNKEQCEMFSKLMESNTQLQEEYLELKEELRAWKGDVLRLLNAEFVDSLSKIGNKVAHELDRHSQQVEGLIINSIGGAIYCYIQVCHWGCRTINIRDRCGNSRGFTKGHGGMC